MKLTKKHVRDYLKEGTLMSVATYGKHPWIASLYYSYDKDLNLYFLSDPNTLHCKQIEINNKVAVSIVDSRQKPKDLKKGLQIYGIAKRVGAENKARHALGLWRKALDVTNPKLTYENMVKGVVSGRMYKITPKRIKFFNQELFKVKDGKEPILVLK